MVKALVALIGVLTSSWLLELAGAALIVWGVYLAYGTAAALVAGGVALVLKAFELDIAGGESG